MTEKDIQKAEKYPDDGCENCKKWENYIHNMECFPCKNCLNMKLKPF